MIDIDNQTSFTVDEPFLESLLRELTSKEIELIITTDTIIQELNKEHRKIDRATDVLSFPYEEMPMAPLGTIVISVDHVAQKAQELGHKENEEFALLFIHGLLHLLGYDHEIDSGEMRKKEKELIEKFALPESLIVRTEG